MSYEVDLVLPTHDVAWRRAEVVEATRVVRLGACPPQGPIPAHFRSFASSF